MGQSFGTNALIGASYLGAVLPFASSIAGGLLGSNATSKSALKQFQYQSALQAQAAMLNYDYGQKSLLNSPSSQRKGLEKAGYNPMLAVQNATSGANAGWTSAGQAQNIDYAGAISAGVANAQSIQRLKNETSAVQAQNDEAYANADKAKAEKNTIIQKLPFISSREKAEIANTEKNTLKLESEIHNIDETTRFIEKNYELQRMLGLLGIDAQLYSADKGFQGTVYNSDTLADAMRSGQNKQSATELIKSLIGAGVGLYALKNPKAIMSLLKSPNDLVKFVPKYLRY